MDVRPEVLLAKCGQVNWLTVGNIVILLGILIVSVVVVVAEWEVVRKNNGMNIINSNNYKNSINVINNRKTGVVVVVM